MSDSQSLCEYLSWAGGLRLLRAGVPTAGAGDLRAMDADTWHKAVPFRRRLAFDDGKLCPDDAALSAWEAGYFPCHHERPDLDELLEAVRLDIATGSVLPGHEGDAFELSPDAVPYDPWANLPPKPPGAAVARAGGLLAYVYCATGTRINGRYCGATLAALLGKPIATPYRAEIYQPGRRVPARVIACGTATERDTRAAAYMEEPPF